MDVLSITLEVRLGHLDFSNAIGDNYLRLLEWQG